MCLMSHCGPVVQQETLDPPELQINCRLFELIERVLLCFAFCFLHWAVVLLHIKVKEPQSEMQETASCLVLTRLPSLFQLSPHGIFMFSHLSLPKTAFKVLTYGNIKYTVGTLSWNLIFFMIYISALSEWELLQKSFQSQIRADVKHHSF